MLTTERKPATIAEILVEEFIEPLEPTQSALGGRWVCNTSTLMNCAVVDAIPLL